MHITCPQCQGQGFRYLLDARWYFRCVTCGLECLLKLLNLQKV